MAITEIEDRISKIIESDNENNFIYDFLSIYNFPKATITKLRKGINNLSKVPGEAYLKNKLYYKQTNANNLMQAFMDVKAKVDQLSSKPRYIMVTNFRNVVAYDTKTKDTLNIPFKRLPQKFEFFLAWNGIEKADFDKENPADIRAAERFAKLFDVIVKDNPQASRKGLNLFFIRVLFCLFAEDTEIFKKNLFTTRIKELTRTDGRDLNSFIKQLFGVLDIKNRSDDTPSWLTDFPYVDGDLFKDAHEDLRFTKKSRQLIIDAGEKLEWDQINPDILGSMLQAVASEDSRAHLGMHYTSVPNIMKVIKPLFLDNLRAEFERDKGNYKKLSKLYDRIGKIKFMDPACGSGNFLIVTYKQLRQLEIDILKEQNKILAKKGTGKAMIYLPSVTLNQFYGIEIDDFACDTTRLSLWIAEHQMNLKLRKEIHNAVRPTLPLSHAGAIVCGNALRLDWEKILPHKKNDEIYVFGNPPYLGSSLQNKEQKDDLRLLFANKIKGYRKLDYVSGWFLKGTDYIKGTKAQIAFVSTNSICQGEQVPILWPYILQRTVINFAYTSFYWSNNAKGNAAVVVVIIGLSDKYLISRSKKIYKEISYKKAEVISPYLTDSSSNIIVQKSSKNLFGLPTMYRGNMPTDGGGLILKKSELVEVPDDCKKYIHPFIGSKDSLNGLSRFVIWLQKADYLKVKNENFIKQRIDIVKNMRSKSRKKSTNELANTPWKFEFISQPKNYKGETLLVPRVSSINRKYMPMSLIDAKCIVSDTATAIYNADLFLFGLLESNMHMLWLKNIGGKLKNDYRYSSELVYNTFPIPNFSIRRKNEIKRLALKILDIREEEGGTLAELYGSPLAEKNPNPMNSRLFEVHRELDNVVDRAYKADEFKDDNERLALLLNMYSNKMNEVDHD